MFQLIQLPESILKRIWKESIASCNVLKSINSEENLEGINCF